jgi:hypothetical protein
VQWMTGEDYTLAYGRNHGYLVVTRKSEVRLSRFSIRIAESGLVARLALGVTRTTIVFPLGRGPGRPGGEPELDALAASARVFAERFEAGEDLERYPAWRQARAPYPGFPERYPGGADSLLGPGGADDCPGC